MCYNKGMANDVGRPVEYTPERIQEIKDAMELYIETHDIPYRCRICLFNNIRRAALYEIAELSYTLGKTIDKKESTLEKGGLLGDYNASMAKFSCSTWLVWEARNKGERWYSCIHFRKDWRDKGQVQWQEVS